MKWFERFLYKKSRQKSEELTHKQCQKIRAASVAFAMAVFLTIIVVLIWLIIPQLIVCIEDIVLSMNEKVQNLTEWVDRFLKQDSPLAVRWIHLSQMRPNIWRNGCARVYCSSLILLRVLRPVSITW